MACLIPMHQSPDESVGPACQVALRLLIAARCTCGPVSCNTLTCLDPDKGALQKHVSFLAHAGAERQPAGPGEAHASLPARGGWSGGASGSAIAGAEGGSTGGSCRGGVFTQQSAGCCGRRCMPSTSVVDIWEPPTWCQNCKTPTCEVSKGRGFAQRRSAEAWGRLEEDKLSKSEGCRAWFAGEGGSWRGPLAVRIYSGGRVRVHKSRRVGAGWK